MQCQEGRMCKKWRLCSVQRVHSIGRATPAVVGQGVCVWCEENVCSIINVRLVV